VGIDDGDRPAGEVGQDRLEPSRVEVACGGGQGAQGGSPGQAERFLKFVEARGLLQATQAGEGRREIVEQQQGQVLVEEEGPIAGVVGAATA
jgi:hypothetical protein